MLGQEELVLPGAEIAVGHQKYPVQILKLTVLENMDPHNMRKSAVSFI